MIIDDEENKLEDISLKKQFQIFKVEIYPFIINSKNPLSNIIFQMNLENVLLIELFLFYFQNFMDQIIIYCKQYTKVRFEKNNQIRADDIYRYIAYIYLFISLSYKINKRLMDKCSFVPDYSAKKVITFINTFIIYTSIFASVQLILKLFLLIFKQIKKLK